MKLKVDDQGHAILQDGKPVYVHDDGKEIAFDAPAAVATIKRISDERDAGRTAAEQAAASLKAFDGIEPDKARAALQTVADLDKGALLTADKVDQLRREIGDGYKAELEKVKTESKAALDQQVARASQLRAKLDSRVIERAFAASPFVQDLAYPSDVAMAYFGGHFKVLEDETIEAVDARGNAISSVQRPGEKAGFDEALGILVNALPDKDRHLKAPEARGLGAGNPARGGSNGKVKTRTEFNTLPPAARMKFLGEGGTLTD